VGDEIKKDDISDEYITYRRGERCIGTFGRETKGKRQLGKSSHRWENNIKIGLQEIGRGGNWIDMVQIRDKWRAFVNTVMNPPIP
jgi:hypothetical protein